MQNNQNNALLIINEGNPDLLDYKAQGYEELQRGNRKYLESVIEETWDSLDMPEDERIFLQVK
jgi:hypothetical protein